jgi:glycosyltransferase involved in cell wall biosynthesis
MRIAFVVQRYGQDFVGGAERYVLSLATGLAGDGHDVSVVTSCATSYEDWADHYEPGRRVESGVEVHRLRVRRPRDNARFLPLHLRAVDPDALPLWPWAQERWGQTMGPDLEGAEQLVAQVASEHDATVLVGYHYSQTIRLTGVAAAHGPAAVVPTAHPEGAFHVGRVRQMFEHADTVICLSPEEAELVAATHGRGDRIAVAPCPVPPVAAPPADLVESVLAEHGLVPGGYAVVVGRVDPAKGSDDAVRYVERYRRRIDPSMRVVVVGPGGGEASRSAAVVPTGFVDERTKEALVAGSRVLLQPSYMESFSLVLIEAWMMERPALVQARSRVLAGHVHRSGGGLTYDGYAGFEVGLAAMERSPELAAGLGRNGREYALREFDWDTAAAAFLAAVSATVERGRHRLDRGRIPTS